MTQVWLKVDVQDPTTLKMLRLEMVETTQDILRTLKAIKDGGHPFPEHGEAQVVYRALLTRIPAISGPEAISTLGVLAVARTALALQLRLARAGVTAPGSSPATPVGAAC